jgi:acyl transferase domain-containing protein
MFFSSQTAPRPTEARELYETQPAFREAVDRAGSLDAANADLAAFTTNYALAELWRSWGVVPAVVAGDSIGELVAACIAGVFSVETGIKLLLAQPSSEREAIASAAVYSRPKIVVASAEGVSIGDAIAEPSFWIHRPGVSAAARVKAAGVDFVLDINPGLAGWNELLPIFASLYTRGVGIDWVGFDRPYGRRKLDLPTYPFDRRRFWIDGLGSSRRVIAPITPAPSRASTYEIAWDQSARAAANLSQLSGYWVVVSDRRGVAASLERSLISAGALAECVPSIDRAEAAIDAIAPAPLNLVFMQALDAPSNPASSADIQSWTEQTLLDLARLIRALSTRGSGHRLWIVTRNAQDVGETAGTSIAQAAVWGFGRVVALEHPELASRLIDLDSSSSERAAADLLAELSDRSLDDQVAVRTSGRYVARLVPFAPVDAEPVNWRADASYLITGGLGSLGLKVARWMADKGARHIVLVGRRGLPDRSEWAAVSSDDVREQIAAVQELEKRGVNVRIVRADVSSPQDMGALLSHCETWSAPLRGVVHAAGVTQTTFIRDLDRDGIARVLRSKVAGAWLIHELTERPLSISSSSFRRFPPSGDRRDWLITPRRITCSTRSRTIASRGALLP